MSGFESVFQVLNTTSPKEDMRKRLTKKLRLMQDLPVGWSYGEGLPVSRSAIALAEDLVLVASDLGLVADVFPSLDGGCAVAFYRDDERVEVSVNADGSLDLTFEKGFGLEFTEVRPRVRISQVYYVHPKVARAILLIGTASATAATVYNARRQK